MIALLAGGVSAAGLAAAGVEEETAVQPPQIQHSELTAQEYDGLLLMREEEKLARDVYLTLGGLWGMNIFYNIAESEENHMDAMARLLDTYSIADPVTDSRVGYFTSEQLSSLYDELVDTGSESLEAALRVGAQIEDLDIKDLQDLSAQTEREDMLFVYANLLKGSENHIRSFTGQLEARGEEYTAVYVDQSYLEEVLAGNSRGGMQGRVERSMGRRR